MPSNIENPFSDYGSIVYGDRFLNRQASLKVIQERVIRPREPGNIAIIGNHRIGKSSLLYKAIMEREKQLISRKWVPIWINLATFDEASVFFRSLVSRCCNDLEDIGWLNETLQKASNRVLRSRLSQNEEYDLIERFFKKVRETDLRVLFILDEFDHARYLFKNNISGFQRLRELSYRPEWRVTFLTTSRRSIRAIEEQTKAISTLDSIFLKHHLSMFGEDGIEAFLDRLQSCGMTLSSTTKDRLDFYCGGHPYLLEMLGYELVKLFSENHSVDVDTVAYNLEKSFLDQYDRMINILREDESLEKLLQILFGPVIDVNQTDVDNFMRYGLIKPMGTKYSAFSSHFHTYLRLVERQADLWSVWRESELALRRIITSEMLKKYGEQWISELEKTRPNLKQIFDNCRSAQMKEQKAFGSKASHNLIDFTYPSDLFAIIFSEWKNTFAHIFGKDKSYWSQRAQLLSKVRNPLAHNRDVALHEYEKQIAEGYCKEIIKILEI